MQQTNDMQEYIIPKNVRTRVEFFSGFGFKELFLFLVGLGVGFLIFGAVYLLTDSLLSFIFLGLGGGVGFFLGKPDPRTGKSALDLLTDYQSFNMKPKRYFYRFGGGRK